MDGLHWILLLLVIAALVLAAVRFDVLIARWRELTAPAPDLRAGPPEAPPTPNPGMHPHTGPRHKPEIHRSGKRHSPKV